MKAFIAIVRMGLWQRRWFIGWWALGIVAFIALNLCLYPSFRDQADSLNRSLADIPDSVVNLFSDTGDFLSPRGYLSSQVFYLMLPLLFSIMAIGLGSSLLAREEKHRTIELLLARPVSRTKLLLAKIVCGVLAMAGVGVVVALITAVLVKIVDFGVSMRYVLLATLASLLLGVLFGGIAFMLTAFGTFARTASIGVAALVAFGGYVVTSLSGTVHWLAWPAKLMPYHYYQPSEILGGNPHWLHIVGLVVAALLTAVIAWVGFRRRDIG